MARDIQYLTTKLAELQGLKAEQYAMQVLIAGGNELLAEMKDRIFDNGIATDGGKIRIEYSKGKRKYTKEDFEGVKGFKPNTTIKKRKTGVEEPAMLIEDGYSGFRKAAGRQNDYVDLDLTSSMRNNLQIGLENDEVVIGFSSQFESDKMRENEERYKKNIVKPSESDIDKARLAITAEIEELIKRTLAQ